MDKDSYELTRTNSICPPPENQLLDYVRNNETQKIRTLVNDNRQLLSKVYDYPYYKPILHLACCEFAEQVTAKTVETLIDLGADLNFCDKLNNYKQAIHYAAISGRPDLLKTVIRNENIDSLSNGSTALHVLIREGIDPDEKENYTKCIKILLDAGINVNKPDGKNLPPIFWAAKKSYKNIIKTILENSKVPVDIDTHKLRDKSTRDLLREKNLYQDNLPSPSPNINNSTENLFSFLKQGDEPSFRNYPGLEQFCDADDTEKTLLQWACTKGLASAVQCLLEKGADPNRTAKDENTPIEIATKWGYHRIFKLLVENNETLIPPMTEIELLKYADSVIYNEEINHAECYKIYLQSNRQPLDANTIDKQGRSALHFAVRYGGSEATLALLKRGASLANKNKFGGLPIEDINADTLQIHLDECLEAEVEGKIDEESFKATFNYKTLMPPTKHLNVKAATNNSLNSNDIEAANNLLNEELKDLVSETEAIWIMSQSRELRHLLKHPVITSFLYMKWHRIRWIFYTNFIFYLMFCLSLVLYIFLIYSNANYDEDSKSSLYYIFLPFLCVTFTILTFRELFQIILLPKKYLISFENMMELILVLVTAWIIFQKSPTEGIRKPLSAFAILLCALVLVLLIGHHPKMSVNIEILRRVSLNFFKFFLWYFVLILAFAFSFYTLFEDSSSTNNTRENNTTDTNEDEDDFFNPIMSLFKTLIMLTGEFDASSINFKLFPIASRLIFVLFVITIAVILLNLLNGLAVNDTQAIKSDAELVCFQALVEHIYTIEQLLLCDVSPSHILKILQSVCCCLKKNNSGNNKIIPQCLIQRICLFPYFLKSYELTIFPNQDAKIELPENYIPKCCGLRMAVNLDRKTNRNTRRLIKEKKDKHRSEINLLRQHNEIISTQQREIAELRQELRTISDKLNIIIDNLPVNQQVH